MKNRESKKTMKYFYTEEDYFNYPSNIVLCMTLILLAFSVALEIMQAEVIVSQIVRVSVWGICFLGTLVAMVFMRKDIIVRQRICIMCLMMLGIIELLANDYYAGYAVVSFVVSGLSFIAMVDIAKKLGKCSENKYVKAFMILTIILAIITRICYLLDMDYFDKILGIISFLCISLCLNSFYYDDVTKSKDSEGRYMLNIIVLENIVFNFCYLYFLTEDVYLFIFELLKVK